MKHLVSFSSVGLLLILSCSSSTNNTSGAGGNSAAGSGGVASGGTTNGPMGGTSATATGGSVSGNTGGTNPGTGGTTPATGGAAQGGTPGSVAGAPAGGTAQGGAAQGGAPAGGTAQGGAPAGGAAQGGTSAGGAGQMAPTIVIDPNRMDRQNFTFNVTDADPTATGYHGGGQNAAFDGSKTVQGYLVITMGGINGGPHNGGAYQWAIGRGFHVLAVDMFNSVGGEGNGGLVYAETFSGQDLTDAAPVTPQNGVMNRVKTGVAYLQTQDPGADWAYYLDSNGEVLWNRVIIWGYSYGGQTAVAATKFVAAHRVVATSAPRIPTSEPASSWITDMPNLTDPANCYAINDNETDFWAVLTSMGWVGPPVRIFDGGALLVQPPFMNTHMLDMFGGHTEFCSLPNAAYDAACDYAFGTVP